MPQPFASFVRIDNVVVKVVMFSSLSNVLVTNHYDAL